MQCTGLSVTYFGSERPAIRDLDLTLARGEAVLLLGPSGSGKSTLGLTLSGLIPNSLGADVAGNIVLYDRDGDPVAAQALTRHVGLVFQDAESQFVLGRVGEEVAFGLENRRVAPVEMPPRIASALARAGLSVAIDMPIDWLSGGQKQRLAIASVLVTDPDLLVLDEPTANLDPAAAAALFAWLAEWREQRDRPTLLLIEHQLEAALPLLDRVIVLAPDGTLLADGTPRDVFVQHGRELVELGIWVPDVLRLALAATDGGTGAVPDAGVRAADAGTGVAAETGESAWLPLTPAEGEAWVRTVAASAPVPADPVPVRSAASDAALTNPPAPIVTVRDLTFAYPGQPPLLRGVSLELVPGRLTALVGPNGSGKSTLASLLAGIRRPPPGTVHWQGRDLATVAQQAIAAQIGYVFQNPEHQFLTQRVLDEVAYGWQLQGVAEAERTERGLALLEHFGLKAACERSPYALSQGQKRRLSVATMVALGQQVLILDEPTFGQDMAGAAAITAELARLRAAGLALLVITHDMRLVSELADEVIVLGDGHVQFSGPPETLFANPERLAAGGLAAPPLVALWQRCRRWWPALPFVADVAGWLQVLAQPAALPYAHMVEGRPDVR